LCRCRSVRENRDVSDEEKKPENKKRINIITIFAVKSNFSTTSFVFYGV
jgi:hypothetical protein